MDGITLEGAPQALASVIIVSFNGRHYLPACLLSVTQDAGAACEVIVVDNLSSDDSAAYVEQEWPDVKLVRSADNQGFAAACNLGASLATGEYLVFLNQDTRGLPGWLPDLLAGLEERNVGLTTSKLLLMAQPDRINLCGQDIHYTGLAFMRGFREDARCHPEPELVGAVSGASFAIKRDLWTHLQGFDEALTMYYEETDLCWRARLAGYHCQYRPGSVLFHDYGPGQHSYARLYYSKRNRYILLFKHWRWATLLLLLPALMVAEILDLGQSALIAPYGLRAKLSAYGWIVTHASPIMASRHRAQRLRKAHDWELLESCTSEARILELASGKARGVALTLANRLFRLNYAFTLALCRALDL